MILYECLSYPNGLMTIIINGGEIQLNLLDFFPSSCLNNQLYPIQKISLLFLITIPFLCTKALIWNSFSENSCSYFLQISLPSQNRPKKKNTYILTSDWKETYLKNPRQWFEHISSTSCENVFPFRSKLKSGLENGVKQFWVSEFAWSSQTILSQE